MASLTKHQRRFTCVTTPYSTLYNISPCIHVTMYIRGLFGGGRGPPTPPLPFIASFFFRKTHCFPGIFYFYRKNASFFSLPSATQNLLAFARACECVSVRVNPPCPPLVRYRRVPPPGRTADTVRSIERVGVSVRECVRACVRVLVLLALGP